MKSKTDFLKQLRIKLEDIHYDYIDDMIEYYDELFEDKKEENLKEIDIIKKIGNIDDIVKNLEVEQKIEEAEKNPTVKSYTKALVAILGILSLPMLLPVILLIFTFFLVAFILLGCFLIVIGSFVVAAIAIILGLFYTLFTDSLPIQTTLVFAGIALILLALSVELFKLFLNSSKALIKWSISKLKAFIVRRKKNE